MSATTNRATLEEMNTLHAQVASSLKGALEHNWKDAESGEAVPPPAALINVAVNFLRMNGITGAQVKPAQITDLIGNSDLPFYEDAIKEVAASFAKSD